MKRLGILVLLLFAGVTFLSLSSLVSSSEDARPQTDTLKAERAKYIAAIREKIKGKEQLPADSVFKNIKVLKGMPAGRMLAIMDVGYSQSLGVSCGHCHDTKDFASEIKPEKQITREMWAFAAKTREMLKSIDGLKSENPAINCTTCHRGQVKPALSLN